MSPAESLETAVLGGGCFWCTQAVIDQLRGVREVVCGYCGGHTPHPTYEQVCSGATGHAECVRILFDAQTISYAELLHVFFQTHDPTTLNRQGHDVGTQYRSVIFYQDAHQQDMAAATIDELTRTGIFPAPIVTQLEPAQPFYPAETYHQDYFAAHPGQPYCAVVIRPKLDKFRHAFDKWLKP